MSDRASPQKESYTIPMPYARFRWYLLVFNVLAFGTFGGAIVFVLWNAWPALGWREALFTLMVSAQIGLYMWLMSQFRAGKYQKPVFIYFVGGLGLWFLELWLQPGVWWVSYMYVGQMFGLLRVRYAFPVAALIMAFVYISLIDVNSLSQGELFGTIAQWVSILLLLVYIGHLNQSSMERGLLIAQLKEAQAKLEAARQQEAEIAVLRERERLARDLHDSLGHALVALSVQLEAIQRLYRVDPQEASAQVDEMKSLARTSMDDLRRSIAGLRSPGLGDRSLCAALQETCVDFGERTGVQIECQTDPRADDLRPALLETIWRVSQEALTNVEKHAQAQRVQLSLTHEPHAVVLRVTDDGIGLPEGAENTPGHFGLRGMRERVEGLGGALNLSEGGDGAVVEARLPLILPVGESLH